MQAITDTLELGGERFDLRWDLGAIATFEDLTGENAFVGIRVNARNVLAVLWSAVDAASAARDAPAPVSYRRFGSLFDTEEKQQRAMEVASRIIIVNSPESKEGAEKSDPPRAARPNRSQRRAATKSARSTSASPSANSGG